MAVAWNQKYQHTFWHNRHFPYSDQIEKEANDKLQEIKLNLSQAIQMREMVYPGVVLWIHQLHNFIKMYSLMFSKEDHVLLIKIVFELLTSCRINLKHANIVVQLLIALLKKRRLLSRQDLVLPWRPVYKLFKEVFTNKVELNDMNNYPRNMDTALAKLGSFVSYYFPIESTQEILDEFRPMFCAYDTAMFTAVEFITKFLPVLTLPEDHHRGFKLWFDEFIDIWLTKETDSMSWVGLFACLAWDALGYVDWNPHLKNIFSFILKSFALPLGNSVSSHFGGYSIATNQIPGLIVNMLGGTFMTQEYLSQLMISLESFYHPSNFGYHTAILEMFLSSLISEFVDRLHRERHSFKDTWMPPVPDKFKLTEEDIDKFVDCVLPAVKQCMFSKLGPQYAVPCCHNLALLRPQKLLPYLLEMMYAAFGTLTEPHQLHATLRCMSEVARPLLGDTQNFPEGRFHLFSLLTSCLPGIDPNDFQKTLSSSHLIASLITLVPLVDCSRSTEQHNMTQEEIEICSLTSQFEDFVIQLLDKCFSWIENCSLEQVALLDRQLNAKSKTMKIDDHESLMGAGITALALSLFNQSSPPIAKVAVKKLYEFASTHLFESEISGDVTGRMCAAAAKYYPEDTLGLFVPHCIQQINEFVEDKEHNDSDNPDKNLVWKLQLLSQVLNSSGRHILTYLDDLLACLSECVNLKAPVVYEATGDALFNLLRSFTMMFLNEGRSVNINYTVTPEEHCYIRDWAKPGDLEELGISWHIPSPEELNGADHILEEFLSPQLEALEAFMGGDAMEREELNRRLTIISVILKGAAGYIPQWIGEQVVDDSWPRSKYTAEPQHFRFITKCGTIVDRRPPEKFNREKLAHFFDRLFVHMSTACEDDTRSLITLSKIIRDILINFGVQKKACDQKFQSYEFSKKGLGDRLHRNKQHLRTVLLSRIYLQHEKRQVAGRTWNMTALHHRLLHHLLALSVSDYPEVRLKAQAFLYNAMFSYKYGVRSIAVELPKYLKDDPAISHEKLKGALYVLKMPSVSDYYVKVLDVLELLLPALIKAGHSEKPSISQLFLKLMMTLDRQAMGLYADYKLSDEVISLAGRLAKPLSSELFDKGVGNLEGFNKKRHDLLNRLTLILVDLFENSNLSWRFGMFCIQLIGLLIPMDKELHIRALKVIVHSLIHESSEIRKDAWRCFRDYLWLSRREPLKMRVDLKRDAGMEPPDNMTPGEREDNEWLLYDPERAPKTAEEWNSFPFVDKSYFGFYCWPKEFKRFAPLDKQPKVDRSRDELSEHEKVIYDAFTSESYVARIIEYLCLEDKKGQDMFRKDVALIFRRLARAFGDTFLPHFKPHLEKLAVDKKESHQRCACEVITGFMRGSKHWPFEMVQRLRDFLEPLLRRVFDNITEETINDWQIWASEVAADRDPHRIHWILTLIAEKLLKRSNGSFQDCSQLVMLRGALAQEEWRIGRLHQKVLEDLKPHLGHPYKNVRDNVASLLAVVCHGNRWSGMSIRHNVTMETIITTFQTALPNPKMVEFNMQEEESKEQVRILKTAIHWLSVSWATGGMKAEYLPLLLNFVPLINIEGDDELSGQLKKLFKVIANSDIKADAVPLLLQFIESTLQMASWKARLPILEVLQVMVFRNMFKFKPQANQVKDFLMQLLQDDKVEVRELAAETLSGLIHCGMFTASKESQVIFKKLAKSKMKKGPNTESVDGSVDDKRLLIRKHAGVLGLAALVLSCPYTVPEWLPTILEELAGHLHDPAPIPSTVKKAMSEFKRTHHDNWRDHKQKFSEDQLLILNELLISPSYYA